MSAGPAPDARLFTGPRGGRISTAVLRDATHWDDVVIRLGYEHLRRHDLRHTGLTWFADTGVPVHVLRRIAGHGSLMTTQRYLHPDVHKITAAGAALSAHLSALRAPPLAPEPDRHDPLTPVKGALVPNWSPRTIKGRPRISPKPALTCDSHESGTCDPLTPRSEGQRCFLDIADLDIISVGACGGI
ncbi:tyrosine-type recombinase/integrase [Streptomyces sp. SCL15-4]|uniref:tyrosine-type recombinase/integrase n=1 Tax=Streptomyces sp. SCL15-4 TaxID=2967221 RepID=UPI0039902E42